MQAEIDGEKPVGNSKLIKEPKLEASYGENGQARRIVPVRRRFLDIDEQLPGAAKKEEA